MKKKADIRIVLLAALLIVAVAVILVLLLGGRDAPDPETAAAPTVIGGGEPIPEEQEKPKDYGNTHLPAYGTLHFTAGQKEQSTTLMNPGENTCYLRISLILTDGTTIYTSELVPPGYATAPITLIAPIERGIYRDVTLRYDCFADEAGQEQINGATCKLDIVAK